MIKGYWVKLELEFCKVKVIGKEMGKCIKGI